MKKSRIIILLFIAGILVAPATSHRHEFADGDQMMLTADSADLVEDDAATVSDTVTPKAEERLYLPRELRETPLDEGNATKRNYESVIHLLART